MIIDGASDAFNETSDVEQGSVQAFIQVDNHTLVRIEDICVARASGEDLKIFVEGNEYSFPCGSQQMEDLLAQVASREGFKNIQGAYYNLNKLSNMFFASDKLQGWFGGSIFTQTMSAEQGKEALLDVAGHVDFILLGEEALNIKSVGHIWEVDGGIKVSANGANIPILCSEADIKKLENVISNSSGLIKLGEEVFNYRQVTHAWVAGNEFKLQINGATYFIDDIPFLDAYRAMQCIETGEGGEWAGGQVINLDKIDCLWYNSNNNRLAGSFRGDSFWVPSSYQEAGDFMLKVLQKNANWVEVGNGIVNLDHVISFTQRSGLLVRFPASGELTCDNTGKAEDRFKSLSRRPEFINAKGTLLNKHRLSFVTYDGKQLNYRAAGETGTIEMSENEAMELFGQLRGISQPLKTNATYKKLGM